MSIKCAKCKTDMVFESTGGYCPNCLNQDAISKHDPATILPARTNDCIDCRHYKKSADDKARDIYIVDGVEMNAKEYIRHLESENERLQQELESMPVMEPGVIIQSNVSLFNSQNNNVIAESVKKHYQKIYDCIEVCELLEEMADFNCKLSKPCGHWKVYIDDYVIYIASFPQESLISVLRTSKLKRWLP